MTAPRWFLAGLFMVLPSAVGCQKLEKWLFTRYSPTVDRAVHALDTRDAGDAISLLSEYLNTGRCKAGNLGTPDSLRDLPNAGFDLGLALFEIAERFGEKFGVEPSDDPSRQQQEGPLLAKRSEEVECAQRIVRLIAADKKQSARLRAEAYYLSGNLEFLRHEYRAAVTSYESALELYPGGMGDAGMGIGTKAAWNRAIALRRAEEDEEQQDQPDAGSPESQDGGTPEDGEQDQEQDEKEQDDQQDGEEDQQEQQPDEQDQHQQNQDQQDQRDQGEEQEQPSSPQSSSTPPSTPPPEQSATPNRPSLSQDEQILEMLERAPMLQQELPKVRGGARRRSMEDK